MIEIEEDIQGRGNSLNKGLVPGKHMESVISPLGFFKKIQNLSLYSRLFESEYQSRRLRNLNPAPTHDSYAGAL